MTTALLLDSVFKEHAPGPGHPECPERYDAVTAALSHHTDLPRIPLRSATADELALCHTRRYIAQAEREIRSGLTELTTGDTNVGLKSYDVAIEAVGSVLNAVDWVMEGKVSNAFCAVRPPGHHASNARGMGFCVFNNIAVAARYAQQRFGVERVMIADWDVHHGNGTQDIFYQDGSVFFFSTHQSPWYPGTGAHSERGEGKGEGSTLNLPLPAGSGRPEVLGGFQERLLAEAKSFRPDLVLISAGFDSRLGDPLGQFRLTDPDFADLTRVMLEIAATYAGGRLVSLLEGGYSLTGLAAGVASHVDALKGIR
ncbi:MAG TPA: histone deacetylase [Bryobacteraceae bacterium]|jgi:acetoin utilization deacetylase AcuC-like enzyme